MITQSARVGQGGHWFVTFDQHIRVLPAKAQSDLLQAHFDEWGRLPPWNDEQ